MSHSKTFIYASACIWLILHGQNSIAESATIDKTKSEYGVINFDHCTLPIPEISKSYNLSDSGINCQNNKIASMLLENAPSAMLIQLYENESCSDAKVPNNFFIKLKTTKQPTTWAGALEVNNFKNVSAGYLYPGRNLRVEEQWEGSEYSGENWSEKISCIYIERSQPVN